MHVRETARSGVPGHRLASAAFVAVLTFGCAGGDDPELESAEPKLETVYSADGTQIGVTKVGSGPVPLVIVHGALNSGDDWLPVATAMAEHCTCFVMDRRGRGQSGDGADYAFDREAEDIEAVLEAAGGGAYLLGHSSGAIYALEAARRQSIAGLILYEPPLHLERQFRGIFERIRPLMQEERFEDAVALFFREEAGMPEEQLSALRSTPVWSRMVALASTAHREWEAMLEADLTVDRYRDLSVPTLLLTGTVSADHPSFGTRALEATLPDSRTAMLDGQAHSAHRMAPEVLARVVTDFLVEVRR